MTVTLSDWKGVGDLKHFYQCDRKYEDMHHKDKDHKENRQVWVYSMNMKGREM